MIGGCLFLLLDLLKDHFSNQFILQVVQLVRAVMYCLIEKPVSKISTSPLDDWSLRKRSALMLCHIDRYCTLVLAPYETRYYTKLKTFSSVVL